MLVWVLFFYGVFCIVDDFVELFGIGIVFFDGVCCVFDGFFFVVSGCFVGLLV